MVVLAVLVLQALALWGLREAATPRPQAAPVAVVAPSVVADAIAHEGISVPGAPIRAERYGREETARAAVARGELTAAVVVDLTDDRPDRLIVHAGRDPRAVTALGLEYERLAAGFDHAAEVQRIGRPVDQGSLRLLAALSGGVGLALALIVIAVTGPRPVRLGPGLGVLLVAASVVVGQALAWPTALRIGSPGQVGLVVAAVALVTALAALAGRALLGWAGVGIGAIVLLAPAVLALITPDPILLHRPAQVLYALLPATAAADALRGVTVFETVAVLRPGLVLLAWGIGSVLLLALARRRRSRRRATHTPSAGGWWGRLALVLLPFGVGLIATALLISAPQPAPAAPQVPASATECLDPGPIETVADLNRLAGERNSDAFQGGDVGATATLGDGRTVWVFGDTLRARGERLAMVRNSMLITDESCLTVVLPDGEGAVIPNRPDDRWNVGYWPMSVGVESHDGYDVLVVGAQRVRTVGRGAFDFETMGPSAAVFIVPNGGVPQHISTKDFGADNPSESRPMWGAASAVSDGWIYLYGTSRPVAREAYGFGLSVARVRAEDLLRQDQWQYWNGTQWSVYAASARPVIDAVGGTSQTLSVFERDGQWYAVSKRDEFIGEDLVIWTAPAPTGPFTAHPRVASIPSLPDGTLRYMPLAHPGLLPEPGSVVVSYSENHRDVEEILADPSRYRIHFLRVPLP